MTAHPQDRPPMSEYKPTKREALRALSLEWVIDVDWEDDIENDAQGYIGDTIWNLMQGAGRDIGPDEVIPEGWEKLKPKDPEPSD